MRKFNCLNIIELQPNYLSINIYIYIHGNNNISKLNTQYIFNDAFLILRFLITDFTSASSNAP